MVSDPPRCAALVALLALGLPRPAAALEATETLSFTDARYTYEQTTTEVPLCPALLETLFSLETLRELMSYADTIDVLEDTPTAKTVHVAFRVLGLHGSVDYLRELDPTRGTLRLRMLSHDEGGLLPYPTAFQAGYLVTHDGAYTRVVYTQEATTTSRIALPHQVFIQAQMSRYGDKLTRIIERSCP